MALFADDVVRIADGLGIGRFALLGHSFGGWVAQELVLRHPDRVTAAIFAATTPGQLGASESPDDDQGPPPPPAVQQAFAEMPSLDGPGVARTFGDLAEHVLVGGDRDAYRREMEATTISVTAMHAVFDALSRWSSVDRLGEITCPVLVLAARHDVFTSWEQSQRIAGRIPGAELVTQEQSGHVLWMDEPDAFFATVGGWLAARAT
jgi:pimeloyl-ACP methyl ester carboxylesterase